MISLQIPGYLEDKFKYKKQDNLNLELQLMNKESNDKMYTYDSTTAVY